MDTPYLFEEPPSKKSPLQSPPSPSIVIEKPITKAKMLAKTSKSICTLMEHVQGNITCRPKLIKAKQFKLCSKAKALERAKYMFAIKKQMLQIMRNVDKTKELGIICGFDFKL